MVLQVIICSEEEKDKYCSSYILIATLLVYVFLVNLFK